MASRPLSRRTSVSALLLLLLFIWTPVLWAGAALVWWSEDRLLEQTDFVTVVTRALRSQDSRDAIAAQAWDGLRGEFGLLRAVDQTVARRTISELLERPGWTPLFRDSARALYLSATAEKARPVTFDLARDYPLLLEALLPFDPAIFDELRPVPALGNVVLLPAEEVPPLGVWLPPPGWLGTALFLAGFAALVGVVATRPSATFALALMGGAAGAAGLLLLVCGPLLGERVTQEAGGRIALIVTQALLDLWQESLRALALRIALAGAVVLALATVLHFASRLAGTIGSGVSGLRGPGRRPN